jgi:cell division protein FtsZ
MENLNLSNAEFAPVESSTLANFSFLAEPNILVVGCGGAGNNCINRLQQHNLQGATTIAINTDKQHLEMIEADKKILIGKNITQGMGVGGDPRLAMKCVDVSKPVIEDVLRDVELVFVIAGMGGGTGTGIAPLIAEIAKQQGSIVVGIATTPFKMERLRVNIAKVGLLHLRKYANSLIILDNNKLSKIAPKLPMNEAFGVVDNLIAEIIFGITDTINQPSLINLDFADVKAIMCNGGIATMLFGEGTTSNTDLIIKNSLRNPLMESNYKGAIGALIHITGGEKLSLKMVQEITAGITYKLDNRANIIMGASIRPELGKRVKVLTIMTGLQPPKYLCPVDDELRDNIRERMPRPDFSYAMYGSGFDNIDDYRMP